MTELDESSTPVLKRRLTDVPDEVRRVPAPPVPVLAEPYHVRVADADRDAATVSEWMNRPHLVEAWEYPWPPQRWHRYLSAQLAGTWSRPLIAGYKGREAGYLEVYRAAQDSIATRYTADPHDVGLHAAIADLDLVNRGLAAVLLPKVVASIFEQDPRCRRIMFDPDHRNTGARRVCEFVGCVFLGEHDMPNRRMSLYALPRTPDDVPAVLG
ncbi:GNAT family N-acetyltransferase [uncultured Mycolicibacterium sp.]|uniref:GNAT family N-acetyltransferase n=1 Tax=uncultured Mycolicibacterium sp. TaxID=2320817 RepID=UPI0026037A39|nr:GNAT family N-acetyltransferase [uncultured Mycolicibacterium sp.]